MKLRIKEGKQKVSFWLPTSFLKWKIVQKKLLKNTDMDEQTKEKIIKVWPVLLKTIKQYKKEHGQFKIIEIESEESVVTIEI